MSKAKVLVLGDTPSRRRALRGHLAPWLTVVEGEPRAALAACARAGEVGLVVLDLDGPSADGVSLCRALKGPRPAAAAPPLLVVCGERAGRRGRRARPTFLTAGADQVLLHPVEGPELRAEVHALLAREASSVAPSDAPAPAPGALRTLKDELVGLIAHDLRSPVAGLAVLLHALYRDSEDREQRQDLDTALRVTQRVHEAIDDLLEVRDLDQSVLPFERSRVRLEDVVREAMVMLRHVALGRGITLREELDPSALALADPKLLRRGLENLLANALRHSSPGGEVTVRLERHGDQARIEVGDRGPGLAPATRAELLAQAAARPGARPHGLGLYLVNLVARVHDADLEVVDRDGGGLLVRLSLAALPANPR